MNLIHLKAHALAKCDLVESPGGFKKGLAKVGIEHFVKIDPGQKIRLGRNQIGKIRSFKVGVTVVSKALSRRLGLGHHRRNDGVTHRANAWITLVIRIIALVVWDFLGHRFRLAPIFIPTA